MPFLCSVEIAQAPLLVPWGKSQSPTSPVDPSVCPDPYSPPAAPRFSSRFLHHTCLRAFATSCASAWLHSPLGSTQPTPSLPVCLKSQQHPPDSSLLLLHAPPQQLSNTLNTVQLHRSFLCFSQHGIALLSWKRIFWFHALS